MKLYYHPLSTYSQKTVMAFHEKEVAFTPEIADILSPEGREAYKQVYPLGKVPLLVLDDGWLIPESSIIVEYLDSHHSSGTRLIPEEKALARRARFHDRQFDLYVNDPMTTVFFDSRKPPEKREPERVAQAKGRLDVMYSYLDKHFAKNTWALGDAFSIADCAAAPPLGYLRQFYPFEKHTNLKSYFGRLAERPSYAKVMAEAAPYLAKAMA
jgi:glutathione S-transferase